MRILEGDSLDVMTTMDAGSIDACVTDPPYGLTEPRSGASERGTPGSGWKPRTEQIKERRRGGFMGKAWDAEVPGIEYWEAVLRVLKPGGYLLAFGGTRTYHRLTCAIEDAGFEIRDCLSWMYGSGFPKSLDVAKAIDKAAGAEREVVSEGRPVKRIIPGADQHRTGSWIKDNGRTFTPTETLPATDAARQWEGWGTALKPAWEPIILARKPLVGTVAQNVQAHGTGALNIDATRIGYQSEADQASAFPGGRLTSHGSGSLAGPGAAQDAKRSGFDSAQSVAGRWPANVVLDEEAARLLDEQSGTLTSGANPTRRGSDKFRTAYGEFAGETECIPARGIDKGGASRFFYCAKASPSERGAFNDHPTVKPLALMRWLVRLVTPPGGTVLDPFMGSGSTLLAAEREGFQAIGIDQDAHACDVARRRLSEAAGPLFAEAAG